MFYVGGTPWTIKLKTHPLNVPAKPVNRSPLLAPGKVRDALIEKAKQYEAEMREKVLSD